MIEDSLGVLLAIFLGCVTLIVAIATAVLAKLSGDEVSGWLPVWSNRLLESAVAHVPSDYQERYREEWKAELAAFRDRRLAALRFAWRLRRRAHSVDEALRESEGLREMFQPEPPPIVRPLDAETVAEIVRRIVDRTRPRYDDWDQILEELRGELKELDASELVAEITRRYLGDVATKRRQGRERKAWKAPTPIREIDPKEKGKNAEDWGVEEWRIPLSRSRAQTPLEIERDAQWRQRVAEARRGFARRRWFRGFRF